MSVELDKPCQPFVALLYWRVSISKIIVLVKKILKALKKENHLLSVFLAC
jgi:hypothetical protein